jgi:hypothetical protein
MNWPYVRRVLVAGARRPAVRPQDGPETWATPAARWASTYHQAREVGHRKTEVTD